MTPAEAAALLTIAAGFDNRKPDADQARAWAMALDGLRFEDCREAIVRYYQGSRHWMMPADVIDGVRRLRASRLSAYGPIPPPADIDPDDTAAVQRYEVDMRRAVADGQITNQPCELEAAPEQDTKARVAYLRSQLARRAPTPERPTLAELASSAAAADDHRAAAARAVPSRPAPSAVREAIAENPRSWGNEETP